MSKHLALALAASDDPMNVNVQSQQRTKQKDLKKKLSKARFENDLMINYLQKTAANHMNGLNNTSRQQSKQKINLKLQECYGKNQKQALIAMNQQQA